MPMRECPSSSTRQLLFGEVADPFFDGLVPIDRVRLQRLVDGAKQVGMVKSQQFVVAVQLLGGVVEDLWEQLGGGEPVMMW